MPSHRALARPPRLWGLLRATEPSFDVRAKPAPSAAGALFGECAGAHPAVDCAPVPPCDPLNVSGTEYLIDAWQSFSFAPLRVLTGQLLWCLASCSRRSRQ